MKTQLLCTFTNLNKYKKTIRDVLDFYDIVFGKIYVLQNLEVNDELLLTYNINSSNLGTSYYENTISVHRKKDTNTLYTINSLNQLIKNLNNGKLDVNYSVNWSDYKNSVLLTTTLDSFKIISTKLHNIIEI